MNPVRISLPALTAGRLLARPNRFLGQVQVGDQEILAHIADPGRLQELLYPGAAVYVAAAANPQRKTAWDLKLVRGSEGLVSVDSGVPNRIASLAFQAGVWPLFAGYDMIKAEPRHQNSRFDFLLQGPDRPDFYVEIKGCTLVENGVALFPDAPTTRGARQVSQLTDLAVQGRRAAVVFIIQRSDAAVFRPHARMDPTFSQALSAAAAAGVAVLAYGCRVSESEIVLSSPVPVQLPS